MPRYSITPACEPSCGRSRSSARLILVSASSGCRSWTSSRLSTSGSAASASNSRGPASGSAPRMATIALSPAPYSSTRQPTSSSAASPACGPARVRSSASSASTRSPVARASLAPAICPPFTRLPALHGQRYPRWRVRRLQHLAAAQVHVNAAGQARVEASHRPHDVDALEVLRGVLLEDRRVLHRVLVRAGGAVAVADAAVPRGGRVRVVVGDLAVPNHHVMGEDTADGLGEAAAVGIHRHVERLPGLGAAGPDLGQPLLDEVQRAGGRVGLEVGP